MKRPNNYQTKDYHYDTIIDRSNIIIINNHDVIMHRQNVNIISRELRYYINLNLNQT